MLQAALSPSHSPLKSDCMPHYGLQFNRPTDATNRPSSQALKFHVPISRPLEKWFTNWGLGVASAGGRHSSGSKSPAICRNNSHYITKRCANRNGYESGKLKGFAIMVAPKYPWGFFGLGFAFCYFAI